MIIEQVLQRTLKVPARIVREGAPIGQLIEDSLINAIHEGEKSGEEVVKITVTLSEEDRLHLTR
tara:strand:+ start:246 stop:437 length:192 start_codon:yes stop_codon:yes gene_type:complete